jgi:hypothetical protein
MNPSGSVIHESRQRPCHRGGSAFQFGGSDGAGRSRLLTSSSHLRSSGTRFGSMFASRSAIGTSTTCSRSGGLDFSYETVRVCGGRRGRRRGARPRQPTRDVPPSPRTRPTVMPVLSIARSTALACICSRLPLICPPCRSPADDIGPAALPKAPARAIGVRGGTHTQPPQTAA